MTGKAMFVAVILLVGFGSAHGEKFYANRDNSVTGLGGTPGERESNRGAVANDRLARPGQHATAMGWDTQAIKDWQTANPLGGGQTYQAVLGLYCDSQWPAPPPPADLVTFGTLNLAADWYEGDGGGGFTNFNWTKGTAACIYGYAEAYYTDLDGTPGTGDEVLDTVNSRAWVYSEDYVSYNFYNLPMKFTNSLPFQASSDDHGSYVEVALDDAVFDDLINNDMNRGLRFVTPSNWDQKAIRMSNDTSTTPIRKPYIDVTIIPEPATMSLLGLGLASMAATAAMRRRRK